MPYFTRQVAPNGYLIVPAMVGVSHARRTALIANKQIVPTPVQVQALIDTGATGTCVDPSVLKQLSLSPTGNILVHTPSTAGQPVAADTYDVSLTVHARSGQLPLSHHTVPVLASHLLAAQGFHVIIGIDILKGCMMTYDGANGLFSLAY